MADSNQYRKNGMDKKTMPNPNKSGIKVDPGPYIATVTGYVKDGIDQRKAPDGTYFYFIFLNDPDYPEPLKGFLFLNH